MKKQVVFGQMKLSYIISTDGNGNYAVIPKMMVRQIYLFTNKGYKLVIVETSKEFRKFAKTFNKFDSIVIPIECDFNKHPKDTRLCLLYVKTMSKDSKEYILPFRHSDTINLEPHDIDNIWTTKNVYTYDKKKATTFF